MKSYFSHDSNARNSVKIMKLRMALGAAGYGIYFMLLERLREEENYTCKLDYQALVFDLREEKEIIRRVIEDFDLFTITNVTEDNSKSNSKKKKAVRSKVFFSVGFSERMGAIDEISKKRSEAGKKGMAVRWAKENDKSENTEETDNKEVTKILNNKAISNQNKIIANLYQVVTTTDNNKIKLNKIKENSSSPIVPSPSLGSGDGGGESSLSEQRIDSYTDLRVLLKDKCEDNDIYELMRLTCGGHNEHYGMQLIHEWLENAKGQNIYDIIQKLQRMESSGQIKVMMPSANWKCVLFLRLNCPSEYDNVIRMVGKDSGMLDALKVAIKECESGRVNIPGKFIMSELRKVQISRNKAKIVS